MPALKFHHFASSTVPPPILRKQERGKTFELPYSTTGSLLNLTFKTFSSN